MLRILRDSLQFFRQERLYFLLTVFIAVSYAAVLTPPPAKHRPHPKEPSKAVRAFKTAEDNFERKMSKEDAYQEFSKKKPLLAGVFVGLTLLFLMAIGAGVIMNVLMIVRPAWFSGFVRGVAPPQKQPWPFSILFKTVVLFMTWGIVVSAVSGLIEAVFPKFGSDNFYMILHTALLDALCVFFMVRFLHRQGSGWRELGFQVPDGKVGREIGVGLAAYVGFLPVFFLVLIAVFFFASLMAYEPPPHPLVNVFLEEEKRQPLLVMFSVLLGTVIGPIFEEIFFRGFCYPVLRGRIGKFWAMTASSIFFAATHRSGFAFWPIFVLGMGLAYLYESRKSLISPIVMHITHNTLFILYFFLVKQVIS